MKRILLLGHTGYLGSYLYWKLSTIRGIEVETVRVDKSKPLYEQLPDKVYDYIINCIGLTDVGLCESDVFLSYKANVVPSIIIKNKYPGTPTFLFSSYYVYNKPKLNEEEDANPISVYSQHKLLSESVAKPGIDYVFRLGKLFGNNFHLKRAYIDKLLECRDFVFSDKCFYFNPTSVSLVSDIVSKIISGSIFLPSGVYNLANDGPTDSKGVAAYVSLLLSKKHKTASIDIPHQKLVPVHALMDTKKISSYFNLPHWTEDILCIV